MNVTHADALNYITYIGDKTTPSLIWEDEGVHGDVSQAHGDNYEIL